MAKNTCDGDVYIHNLATFIKSHERQLANALLAYKKLNTKNTSKTNQDETKKDKSDKSNSDEAQNSNNGDNESENTPRSNELSSTKNANELATSSNEEKRTDSNIDEDDNLTKEMAKPVRLSLSLHHLYFILGKFKELGIPVGPLNLRLDNMDSENSTNYVSFLSEFQRNKKQDSDAQSIHSISSVKSVMSSVSALWNNFGSTSKIDNTVSDLKYLFSAFSKLPCLRLANEPNAKLIEGHEEYPFETATPILIFKNVLVLELSDLEPKEVYGWHILSSKLRYLVVKKAHITDPLEVLVTLVSADGAVKIDDEYATETEDNGDDNYLTFESTNNGTSRLTKSKSNTSDSSMGERPGHKYSLSSSSTPTSYSSLNMSANLGKTHVSPTLHQTASFNSPYQNLHTYNYSHNYINQNLNFNHHFQHNHNHHLYHPQMSNDTIQSFSTSPTPPLSSNHNRLYIDDAPSASQQTSLSSSVHSTRRSYYYKPPKKSGRSRGSTSVAVHPLTTQHASTSSVKSHYEPNSAVDLQKTHSYKRSDEMSNPTHSDLLDRPHADNPLSPTSTLRKSPIPDETAQPWKLLKHLSFTENKIEEISFNAFDSLINLTLLDLSYNNLTQIPQEPLSKLLNLKTLNLSFNKLTNTKRFPKTLQKLTILNLRGNKLGDLESVENLSSLQKIDLRQNNFVRVTELKPLLLLNRDTVRLNSIHLSGNPLSKSRGYRTELFNLFNGVDYTNCLKIDGSRPGIFESRMLLDEKTARLRFKNYMDESMISKMTASVSSMNLNLNNMLNHGSALKNKNLANLKKRDPSVISNSSKNLSALRREGISIEMSTPETEDRKESSTPLHPVLDQMSTLITVDAAPVRKIPASPPVRSSLNGVLQDNSFVVSRPEGKIEERLNAPEQTTGLASHVDNPASLIMSTPSLRHPVTFTHHTPTVAMTEIDPLVNINQNSTTTKPSIVSKDPQCSTTGNTTTAITDYGAPVNKPISHSQRGSTDFSTASSIITANTSTGNGDSNPIARLSLASPALPVITQATTTTMSITNITTSGELANSHSVTPKSVSHSDYFSGALIATDDNKENITKGKGVEDLKLPVGEDYSSGLKISVV